MKTTIDIAEALLEEAKRIASRDATTLGELIESGLRLVLQRRATQHRFSLRDARVDGKGLQRELAGAGFDRIRDAAYGDPPDD